MSLRYMGTKRALAPVVREAIAELEKPGQVADLFSGMGSVATSMASTAPVLTNDALAFTTSFARAQFLPGERLPTQQIARLLFPNFSRSSEHLRHQFRRRLAHERTALADREKLAHFMETAAHVGTSAWYQRQARLAASSVSIERYRLATLYFSAGYFSTAQAIELDALRYAIDQLHLTDRHDVSIDWLLAAWLTTAGVVINAPGHSAQYLKPGNDSIYRRIRRCWQRPAWPIFVERLDALQAVGTKRWRARNRVCNCDALDLLRSRAFDRVGVVYADPPYTKDHYSRFYHVYETLYRYDFPSSDGSGRYPTDRFQTPFSLIRTVEDAFQALFAGVAQRGLPLVLSYPENGLLNRRKIHVTSMLREYFSIQRVCHVTLQHSTFGASSGSHTKAAHERVYVCVP